MAILCDAKAAHYPGEGIAIAKPEIGEADFRCLRDQFLGMDPPRRNEKLLIADSSA